MNRIINTAILLTILLTLLSARLVRNVEAPIRRDYTIINNSKTPEIIVKELDLDLISPSSGIQFYKDGIVFLANTKDTEPFPAKHISFGKKHMHYAPMLDSVLGEITPFSSDATFIVPAEGMCFNNDYSSVLYSSISEEDGRVKIYRANSSSVNDISDWSSVSVPLSFCNDFNYTHPALSKDNNTMVFSSDKNGGQGEMDLYISNLKDGKWSEPVNLGNKINSAGNELFAFIDSFNNLFFSSDGLSGKGDYDIFICKYDGKNWKNPVNINWINTEKDEIAFKIDKQCKKGIFTRRKTEGSATTKILMIDVAESYSGRQDSTISSILYSMNAATPGDNAIRNRSSKNKIEINSFHHIDLSPPSSGVQFYRDGILFLLNTKESQKISKYHLSFGNKYIYYTPIIDSVPGRNILFSAERPLSIPADGITFNNDYSQVYISSLSDSDNKVRIYHGYSSVNDPGNEWSVNNEPLSFCDNFNYTHPALSFDNSIMIFSSDMTGGNGGMDLYITLFENGKWATPHNLGNKINSEGDELFAFLDLNNNLYFSSDGLLGYGGYDIYVSKYNGVRWEEPINLDELNTEEDEIAIKLDRTVRNGFFTRRKSHDESMGILHKINLLESLQRSDTTVNITSLFLNETYQETTSIQETADEKPEEDSIMAEDVPCLIVKDTLEYIKLQRLREDSIRLANERLEAEKIRQKKEDSLKLVRENLKTEERRENILVFRVQILSSMNPRGEYTVTIDGKGYQTYEYKYKGAWRITIGEFTSMEDAVELQRKCIASGFKQAFVAVFRNNERIIKF
jgi:hypothetical protein